MNNNQQNENTSGSAPEPLTVRQTAHAARDAAAYLEALWVGDRQWARLLYDGATEREREAITESLASLVGVALRMPDGTPPGRFVGIVRAMLDDGAADVEGEL